VVYCTFIHEYYFAKLAGIDPNTFGGHFTDSTAIVWILCVSTCCHVLVPVRWCLFVFADMLTVSLYAYASLVIGSPESSEHRADILMMMSFICLLLTVFKRQLEMSNRTIFTLVIENRRFA
jgi:hypothetical protein